MIKNEFLYKNIKLTSIDVLNKFLLTSSFQKNDVNKINMNILSSDFSSFFLGSDEDNVESKINSLSWAYLLCGVFPSVLAIKKKISRKIDSANKEDFFILNFKIFNRSYINQFVSKLMLEHEFFENNLGVDNLNNLSINGIDKINYATKISMSHFFEQQEFFDSNNINCAISKIDISVNFIFNSLFKSIKNKMVLKDLLHYKLQYL